MGRSQSLIWIGTDRLCSDKHFKATNKACLSSLRNQPRSLRHGGTSSGPKTPEGRQRCAEAKTTHGNETRKARTERAEGMRRLRALEDLGYQLGIMSVPRRSGRENKSHPT